MSDDELLIGLFSMAGEIRGRKRLQKIVYVLKNMGVPFSASYFKYYYGPFSRDIEARIIYLNYQGVIEEDTTISPSLEGEEIRSYAYRLTPQGKKYAEKHAINLGEYGVTLGLIEKLKTMDINKLVSLSYKIYDEPTSINEIRMELAS